MTRTSPRRGKKNSPLRIGKVRAFLRGRIWYLQYSEGGKRHQPRVGPDREAAAQMAAEINAQIEVGAPSSLGFAPISIPDLRDRWLQHHEDVRRSSLATIARYRAATEHLIRFIRDERPVARASDFRSQHAEEFVRYLRSTKVAPNGHKKARRRRLRDGGIKFILETACTLFNHARRNRHLSPYAENPFRIIEVGRIPVEDAKPVIALNDDQQVKLLRACDDWQFPIVLTLLLTGLRPGELVHLLLPDDLDLQSGWLYVRNKPKLGWQIKTRTERLIPIVPELNQVLRHLVGSRQTGPVFFQRRCGTGHAPPLQDYASTRLESELARRLSVRERASPDDLDRTARQEVAMTIWRDLGALKEDWIRKEFMRLTRAIGLPEVTAPKTLRHTFATCLQDANVDPLIRSELMGHSTASLGSGALGMTAIYTHTRPETKRRQLELAWQYRPAIDVARERLATYEANTSTGQDIPAS